PMAAQVHRQDVEAVLQPFGDPVPTAGVVAPAVDHEQRLGVFIAPVDIVQPQPLGRVGVRGGAKEHDRFAWSAQTVAAALARSRRPAPPPIRPLAPSTNTFMTLSII